MKGNNVTTWLGAAILAVAASAPAAERAEGPHPAPGMMERPGVKQAEAPKIEPGATVIAHELAWRRTDDRRAAGRLAAAAAVMSGNDPAGGAGKDSTRSFLQATAGDAAGSWVGIEGTGLLVRYDAAFDEIRLLDRERAAIGPTGKDIGRDAIGRTAEKRLAALGEAGVIDSRLYRQAVMQVGYEIAGTGSVEEEIDRGRVVAYRVTYRPRLDGIELANAGVRLGILASGELYSLRVGGVTPAGKWKDGRLQPSGRGGERRVRTDAQALMKRFYAQVPDGVEPSVAWSRVMYVMPEDSGNRQAVVEPKFVVSWSPLARGESGVVAGRRIIQAWSLTDPEAAPVRYDPPPRRHEGDKLTRDSEG